MDLMKMATQVLASKLGDQGGGNADLLQNVVGSLLGGSNNQGIDLGSLVGSLQSSGLQDIAESWLGDGDNADISISQIQDLLGSDKVAQAAQALGADQDQLLGGLREMLPQMVDQNSKGGNLLDAVGGVSGLAGLASKLLK